MLHTNTIMNHPDSSASLDTDTVKGYSWMSIY